MEITQHAKAVMVSLFMMVAALSGCNEPSEGNQEKDRSSESTAPPSPSPSPVQPTPSAPLVLDPTDDTNLKLAFNWAKQNDETLCTGAKLNDNLLALGVAFEARNNALNVANISQLQSYLELNFADAMRIVSKEERLGILNIEIIDCSIISQLRNHETVQFVEPKYAAPINDEFIYQAMVSALTHAQPSSTENEKPQINPGLYDPATAAVHYEDYLRAGGNEWAANVMGRHGIDKIYAEYGNYGSPNMGVAILDNGVHENQIAFLSQGEGGYATEGYYRLTTDSPPDGISPQPYDIYGLLQSSNMYSHGTRMTENVYAIAPNTPIMTVRASPFVVWFTPTQFQGVIESILELAENPAIKIISCSMGTIVYSHEMARAIDYFNAFDKLFIAAAGTTAPVIKDLVKVVFPAALPSVISVTGLKNTADGSFKLGHQAHGGVENDFVVDYSHASSESVSFTAGMIALIWSANPALPREKLIEQLIASSSNYTLKNRKDRVFGWGKVDAFAAYRAVLATKDLVAQADTPSPD